MFHNNGEGIFQQDGARAHTSRASVEWLNKNINGYISPGDWSPNSPDLSPIENVWSIMAATVYAYSEPQTLNALKHRLRKAWTSIPLETFKNLIYSMPNRLEAVMKSKGNIFKY